LKNVKEVTIKLKFEFDKNTEENTLTQFSISDSDIGELINLQTKIPSKNSGKLLKSFNVDEKTKLSEAFNVNLLSKGNMFFIRFYRLFSQNKGKDFETRVIGDFLDEILSELRSALESIRYLGPLRKSSGRYYDLPSEVPKTVGFDGENVIQVFFKDEENIKREISDWVKALGLSNSIKIERSLKTGGLLSVICEDKISKLKVNIADLGFGTSQILPFIVEGFSSPSGTLFIAEQPEIHLHPKAQSYLADMLVAMVTNNRKAIIETHSEHLIVRLQTLIALGKIDYKDVKIYFLNPTKQGTKIIDSQLNDLGEMTQKWPIGFFSESYERSLEFAKAKSVKLQEKK
jgi:hypothetical protein